MTKYFVVFAPSMTAAQEGAFALNLSGMEWWHHLPGCWLIKDEKGRLDAGKIKDFLSTVDSSLHCGVFRVKPTESWATILPKAMSPTSREWIKAHWVPQSDE